MLLVMPVVSVVLAIVVPAVDALGHGPYSTWYNRRCQRIADSSRLVGRPEADVVKILGPPAYTYLDTTYNYVPVPGSPRPNSRSTARVAWSLGSNSLTTKA